MVVGQTGRPGQSVQRLVGMEPRLDCEPVPIPRQSMEENAWDLANRWNRVLRRDVQVCVCFSSRQCRLQVLRVPCRRSKRSSIDKAHNAASTLQDSIHISEFSQGWKNILRSSYFSLTWKNSSKFSDIPGDHEAWLANNCFPFQRDGLSASNENWKLNAI